MSAYWTNGLSDLSVQSNNPIVRIKVCPNLLPKMATLYPETGNFVARTAILLPFRVTSLSDTERANLQPETGDFVAENGNFLS